MSVFFITKILEVFIAKTFLIFSTKNVFGNKVQCSKTLLISEYFSIFY